MSMDTIWFTPYFANHRGSFEASVTRPRSMYHPLMGVFKPLCLRRRRPIDLEALYSGDKGWRLKSL